MRYAIFLLAVVWFNVAMVLCGIPLSGWKSWVLMASALAMTWAGMWYEEGDLEKKHQSPGA